MKQFAVIVLAAALGPAFTPARLASGDVPAPPAESVGWSQASLELAVARDGSVTGAEVLSAGSPFLDALRTAARGWRFTPARDRDDDVATQVLVVGLLRPPVLMDSVAAPVAPPPTSTRTPQPVAIRAPAYPPRARGDGVVVVEVLVDEKGQVASAQVVRSAGGFDESALDAARGWIFQPARRGPSAAPAYVYLVFGFRQPVQRSEC